MSARSSVGKGGVALLLIAASAGLAFFLRAAAEVFVPFTVALVIALAANPAVEWLARRKIPRPLSVSIIVVLSLLLLAVAVLLVDRGVDGFIQNLPAFKARAGDLWSSLARRLKISGNPFENLGK